MASDPQSVRLSFRLEGSKADDGLVRVQDFVRFLEKSIEALRHLERAEIQANRLVYRITSLTTGSAAVEIEASGLQVPEGLPRRVVSRFVESALAVQVGGLEFASLEPELQETLSELVAPLRRNLRRAQIVSDGAVADLSREQLAGQLRPASIVAAAVGSVSGFIDAVNVHEDSVFYLYPTSGATRIACAFDRTQLLDTVRQALKRYTRVFGLQEFTLGSPFPQRIAVDRVEINPREDELPTLASLWGTAPRLTGGVDSVTYVRRQRDATG